VTKYNNIRTELDGIWFDSKKELARYQYLKRRQENGEIYGLELQKKFVLIPKKKLKDITMRECSYVADFCYMEGDNFIVEDVKGCITDVYQIKKKLMFQVHNILIDEI